MTVNQRLGEFLTREGISQSELSRILNVHRSAVSNWFNDKAEKIPAQKIIMMIEKFPNLNARWLITGQSSYEEQQVLNDIGSNEDRYKAMSHSLLDRLLDEKERVGALMKEVEILREENSYLKAKLDV